MALLDILHFVFDSMNCRFSVRLELNKLNYTFTGICTGINIFFQVFFQGHIYINVSIHMQE